MTAGCVKLKMFKANWAAVLNAEYYSVGWSPGLCTSIHRFFLTGDNGTPLLLPRLPGRLTLPSLNHFAQGDKKLT